MSFAFGLVYRFGRGFVHEELFGVHLVLREVFDIDRAEVAQADVERDERLFDPLDLHTFEQMLGEMHAGRRGGYGALFAGENGLVALGVFRLDLFAHPLGQRGFAQFEEGFFELFVGPVEQEPERAAPRSGIVDHLGYQQVVVAEVELVADADFAGRIHQYVPQAQLAVEFAQQEDFDLGARFLLVAVQTGGENLRVVEDE